MRRFGLAVFESGSASTCTRPRRAPINPIRSNQVQCQTMINVDTDGRETEIGRARDERAPRLELTLVGAPIGSDSAQYANQAANGLIID